MRISFVGDIMCEQEQLTACSTLEGYNFSSIFKNIKPVFQQSDFSVGNLETPIAGASMGYTNHKWLFNSPIEFAETVKESGFDLVSTANNHCLDRGVEGIKATIDNLEKINLEQVGLNSSRELKSKPFIKEIDGLKIAFLSYTYGTNAHFNKHHLNNDNNYLVNLFREQEPILKFPRKINGYFYRIRISKLFNPYLRTFKKELKVAKREADYVVVLMHSGGQYNLIPDKWTVWLLNYILKLGANAVIGCHPHVVQKAIVNNKKQIGAFSLGNFCSYPGSDSCKMNESEYSIILHLHINSKEGKLEKVTFEVAKSVINILDKKSNIHLLFDLIQNERDNSELKSKLIEDNTTIVNRFIGVSNSFVPVKKEYDFPFNV